MRRKRNDLNFHTYYCVHTHQPSVQSPHWSIRTALNHIMRAGLHNYYSAGETSLQQWNVSFSISAMQLTESHSVCAQVIDRSVNWSVVESLSQPAVSQSDLSPPVCHKSLTLSLSHAAWLSLCHPSTINQPLSLQRAQTFGLSLSQSVISLV